MDFTFIYSITSQDLLSEKIKQLANIDLHGIDCEIFILDPLNMIVENDIPLLPFKKTSILRSSGSSDKSLKNCAIACASGENIIFANSNYLFSERFIFKMVELHANYQHDLNIIIPNSEINMENDSGMLKLLQSVYNYFTQRKETMSFQWLLAMYGIFLFKKRYLMGRLEFSNIYNNTFFQDIELAYRIQQKGYKCRIFIDESSVLSDSTVEQADKLEDDFENLMHNNMDLGFQLIVIIKEVFLDFLLKKNYKISEIDVRKFIRFETALRCYLNKYITREELMYVS